ncbi:MAG: phosphate signaling complex protein PhoU [Burkholderiales bacterium]|nr:phosphate signaling complex protein PhoU [Burkholderiales bacterium]
MTEHTYRQFDADIDSIRSAFTTMGGLVERQLLRAIDAVRYGDLRLTTAVLVDERQINQMQVESDLRCNQIIAKRQPIAIDLREIIGVIHGVNDLERIGDEAKKIALKAQQFVDGKLPIPFDPVLQMTEIVADMLRSAIDSFLRQDEAAAERLIKRDIEVDALRDELIGALMRRMSEDPTRVSEALSLVFVVQSLERVGDHAKNIAEYIMHVVSGIDSRHPVRPSAADQSS